MTLTTFPIAAGTDDGKAQRSDGLYSVVGGGGGIFSPSSTDTKMAIARGYFGGVYYITNALMRFDTSSIPDDNLLDSATLDLYVQGVGNPDGLAVIGDWYDYGGNPPDAADWINLPSGDALAATAMSSLTTGAVNTFTLQGLDGINLTGFTGIRLGMTQRPGDAAPSGDGYVDFSTFEAATQEPRLNVTYHAPTVGGGDGRDLTLLGAA